jgi:hypothetical protein
MSEKNFPLTKAQLQEIIKEYPTPFHIYDEHAIRQNIRALQRPLPGLRDSGNSLPSRHCLTRASSRSCMKKVPAQTAAARPSSCSRILPASKARKSC